jgi:hypothetical protein
VLPGGFLYAELVPLQFVFHLGNHQLSVVQNGLPVDYPLSASFWRKHYFRDGGGNRRRHETASSDTLAVAETRRPRGLSSCCKVMFPDLARRAFSLLLRQDGSGRQRGLFLTEG